MITNSYYSQENHGPYELHDIGNFALEEGGTIRGCKLAYTTFGTLNERKDNAILIPTWYSGTSKIMEQVYIGQGRALDPDRYFIIVVNQIGNKLSTSPHNTAAPADMSNFPHVRIADDVLSQHKLLTEKFGIGSPCLGCSGSMGAQRPMNKPFAIPIWLYERHLSPGPRRTRYTTSFLTETLADAVTSDLGFYGVFFKSSEGVRGACCASSKSSHLLTITLNFFNKIFIYLSSSFSWRASSSTS